MIASQHANYTVGRHNFEPPKKNLILCIKFLVLFVTNAEITKYDTNLGVQSYASLLYSPLNSIPDVSWVNRFAYESDYILFITYAWVL